MSEMSVTDVTNFRKITWLKSLPICRFRFSIFVLETLETLLVPWIESDLCNYFYGFQVDDRTLIRSNTHKKNTSGNVWNYLFGAKEAKYKMK